MSKLANINLIESRLKAGSMTLLSDYDHSMSIMASRSNEVSNLLGVF